VGLQNYVAGVYEQLFDENRAQYLEMAANDRPVMFSTGLFAAMDGAPAYAFSTHKTSPASNPSS